MVRTSQQKEKRQKEKKWRVPSFPCDVKIYRIFWKDFPKEIGYVGHTRHTLISRRMPGHRSSARYGNSSILYQKIRKRPEFDT